MEAMMPMKGMQIVLAVIGFATLSAAAAHAQTDVGLSFYKTFNSSTSGNGTVQSSPNSAGGMFELRHISKPLLGYEVTYSFNPADQSISPEVGSCGFFCSNPPVKIKGTASEVALDWVVSAKYGSLRPFAVVGLGFFIAVPSSDEYMYDINTIVRPTYVYGGGVDWSFHPRFGLRFQFRGNAYKAPDVSGLYFPTGTFMQTAEPMIGVFFRP
ncbi:MAG: hypothetical protein WAM85_01825 [Terracidiphilus sp.]